MRRSNLLIAMFAAKLTFKSDEWKDNVSRMFIKAFLKTCARDDNLGTKTDTIIDIRTIIKAFIQHYQS